MNDFTAALERIVAGLEKRNRCSIPRSVGWSPITSSATRWWR